MPQAWTVRSVQPADAPRWERMRQELWPAEPGVHAAEIRQFLEGGSALLSEVLIAVDGDGMPIGFVELSVRSHADGCDSRGVGYLEGWFVDGAFRRQGVGAALVEAAEQWARGQGCTEFGSDTDLDNAGSAAAHQALGFAEVSRLICFRKEL